MISKNDIIYFSNFDFIENPDKVVLHSAEPLNPTKEGTEHELQCDIINVAPVQNLTVNWYKDNRIIKTSSFDNSTKAPANKSSTLTVNIGRGDSRVRFRCEAQLDFNQNISFTSNELNVSVHCAYTFISSL